MKNKLEPLSDYVAKKVNEHNGSNELDLLCNIAKYNRFIKQLLSERYEVNGVNAHPLNRFVPCDLEGNVLVEPQNHKKYLRNDQQRRGFNISEHKQYQQAKERVIFEGCGMDGFNILVPYKAIEGHNLCINLSKFLNIESLLTDNLCDLTLTATGLRLSGKK